MQQSVLARSEKATKLRELGPLEQLYWFYGRATPFHFAIAAEVEGETEIEDWRNGLDRLQERHPLFSVTVDEGAPVPSFRGMPGTRIPLHVICHASQVRWEDVVAREMSEPFESSAAPLLRAVLLHQAHGAVIILIADHSISDGISLAFAIRDLLRTMADGKIERLSMLPSIEELTGQSGAALSNPRPPSVAGLAIQPAQRGSVPVISSRRLSPELTERIIKGSRQHGTTVHGMLCAALVLAGRPQSAVWRNSSIRLLSPMNLRPLVGLGEDSMLAVGVAVLRVQSEEHFGIWEMAQRLKSQLARFQSPEMLADMGATIARLAADGMNVRRAADFMTANFTSEGMVSNLGVLPFPPRFEKLAVRNLWGPMILTGVPGEQVLGAATINGALCLTHISMTPFPNLLRAIEETLSAALIG